MVGDAVGVNVTSSGLRNPQMFGQMRTVSGSQAIQLQKGASACLLRRGSKALPRITFAKSKLEQKEGSGPPWQTLVGNCVGAFVGELRVGASVGVVVGNLVGLLVGELDGLNVGEAVGLLLGCCVGDIVGAAVGGQN